MPRWQNGLTDTLVPSLISQLTAENETYRRLGVGSLLGDVLDRFTYATKPTVQKMALYGTHDTTIAAMLATLDIFDKQWPRFTSNITYELFKAQRGGVLSFFGRDKYYVRMRYNNAVMKLPGTRSLECEINVGCQANGKHWDKDASFCTLEAFRDIVEKVRPSNWVEECRVLGISP